MTNTDPAPNQGAWKWWCCAPLAGIALIALAGGAIGALGDTSKRDALEACEQVALLYADGAEWDNAKATHVRADTYDVTATVTAPGLPDQDFAGVAYTDDNGDYVCEAA